MTGVAAHTWIMTNQSDDLPVLVIDGANFSDFDGFSRSRCSATTHGGEIWMPSTTSSEGVRDARERMGAEVSQP
jgi:hypothetical protein